MLDIYIEIQDGVHPGQDKVFITMYRGGLYIVDSFHESVMLVKSMQLTALIIPRCCTVGLFHSDDWSPILLSTFNVVQEMGGADICGATGIYFCIKQLIVLRFTFLCYRKTNFQQCLTDCTPRGGVNLQALLLSQGDAGRPC